jgi:beta-phosphoglucomutase
MASPFLDQLGVRAVIFDMDGVLLDTLPLHYASYRHVLEAEGLAVEPRDISSREGLGTPELLASLSEERGWQLSPQRIQELASRRRRFFWDRYEHRVYPGVTELLDFLERDGYGLAVVSGAIQRSLDVGLRDHPAASNGRCLAGWFPVIVGGTMVARGKPHPDPYLVALEKLSLEGRQALVVENAPVGITAAHAAGCYVAALETTLPKSYLTDADWVLPDHAALLRLLKQVPGSKSQVPGPCRGASKVGGGL